jgi:disulfide bond formation protein DsbB
MHPYRQLNALGIIAISAMLTYAFADQFVNHELPCPLCLLQRLGFVAVSIGLLLNVTHGPRPSHYGFAIAASVAGGAMALRQVSLHVIPGTPGYGSPFLGLHFYTWAFLLFAFMIAAIAMISSLPRQYDDLGWLQWRQQPLLCKLAIVVITIIISLNALAAFSECGPGPCPDNPEQYWLFQD